MTYCVGMKLNCGLVFMSDTRTTAGVDNVSTFRKLFSWNVPGERFVTLLTAGNLATTQAVVSEIAERAVAALPDRPSIVEASTMFQVARIVGSVLRDAIRDGDAERDTQADGRFDASIIVGGQIRGGDPRLFLVYPEGNFIEASRDTPFFQTGETKYGRPILVRAYDPDMGFADAIKLLLVSFDSTLKANLSVGMPFDMLTYECDRFEPSFQRRFERDDAYYAAVSDGWGRALRAAFAELPDLRFAGSG